MASLKSHDMLPEDITLHDITPEQTGWIEQAAHLLTVAFIETAPEAWPTLADGMEELEELLDPENILRGAIHPQAGLVGFVGGQPQYDGNVWELHPMAVHPDWQGRGIGAALAHDLEALVAQRGAHTMLLGTDDEMGLTSLAGVDLYPDVWRHIASIENRRRHPFGFYQKLGYVVTGLIPDANGPGKPDIIMCKRIQ